MGGLSRVSGGCTAAVAGGRGRERSGVVARVRRDREAGAGAVAAVRRVTRGRVNGRDGSRRNRDVSWRSIEGGGTGDIGRRSPSVQTVGLYKSRDGGENDGGRLHC